MKRDTRWIAGLALAVALAGCGDAADSGAGSVAEPAPTTTTQSEVAQPAETVATTSAEATAIVEATSTTVSTEAQTANTITSEESSTGSTVAVKEAATDPSDVPLDQSAVDGLLWMREEEKLARDVYVAFSELWDLPIFANIADSERTHTDAVGDLLDHYDIPDPMVYDVPGVFDDPTIQKLYDDLVAQGSQSLVDALIVGATIEDMDIVDLQLRRSGVEAIDMVYANLEKGSRNHLRAFIRTLERQGGEYAPSYLSVDEYEAIIEAPTERGRAGG